MSDQQFELLLQVLELAEPRITGRSLRRNLGSGADDLIRSGILTPVAPEAPLPDPRWHDSDDLAFESGWDAPLLVGQASKGAAADVGAYRISFARLLDMLSRALDLVAAQGATELLADHAWDLGDLWISRSLVGDEVVVGNHRLDVCRLQLCFNPGVVSEQCLQLIEPTGSGQMVGQEWKEIAIIWPTRPNRRHTGLGRLRSEHPAHRSMSRRSAAGSRAADRGTKTCSPSPIRVNRDLRSKLRNRSRA